MAWHASWVGGNNTVRPLLVRRTLGQCLLETNRTTKKIQFIPFKQESSGSINNPLFDTHGRPEPAQCSHHAVSMMYLLPRREFVQVHDAISSSILLPFNVLSVVVIYQGYRCGSNQVSSPPSSHDLIPTYDRTNGSHKLDAATTDFFSFLLQQCHWRLLSFPPSGSISETSLWLLHMLSLFCLLIFRGTV